MSDLTKFPNIGKELAKCLEHIGINSAEEFIQTVSKDIFIRLKTVDNTSCFSRLCVLEGAVRGIRWHQLSSERKQELRVFLKMVEKGNI